MGYSDIGCYGGEIETPNLDMLAKNGVHFSQFYNTSRCSPTRSSLISGLYSHQAGMGLLTNDQGEHNPGYRGRLMERCVTIAEVLRPQGYLSITTGKWHMGHEKKEWWPLGRGFDRFYGCPQGGGFFFRPSSWGGRTVVRGDEVIYDKERDPAEGGTRRMPGRMKVLNMLRKLLQRRNRFSGIWHITRLIFLCRRSLRISQSTGGNIRLDGMSSASSATRGLLSSV